MTDMTEMPAKEAQEPIAVVVPDKMPSEDEIATMREEIARLTAAEEDLRVQRDKLKTLIGDIRDYCKGALDDTAAAEAEAEVASSA